MANVSTPPLALTSPQANGCSLQALKYPQVNISPASDVEAEGSQSSDDALQTEKSADEPHLTETPSDEALQTETPAEKILLTEEPSDEVLQTEKSSNEALQTEKFLNGALQTEKALNGALQTNESLNGALQTEKSLNGALQTDKSLNGALKTDKFLSEPLQSVTSSAVQPPIITSKPAARTIQAAKYPRTNICLPSNVEAVAAAWLASFNQMLIQRDFSVLPDLFFDESYWRDHLALSWDFRTFKGPPAIQLFLEHHPQGTRLKIARLNKRDTFHSPKLSIIDQKSNSIGIQAFLDIETDVGVGKGVAKLLFDAEQKVWKAFTLYTAMQELKSHQETIKFRRPRHVNYGNERKQQNWLDKRIAQENFANGMEPTVLIVGAGQAGLSTAARLQQIGVSSLIIDHATRIGDSWRNRYHRMVLHDPVWYNHLPYFSFPDSWPVFAPKDKIADWMEVYARVLELNVWTSTSLRSARWIGGDELSWDVTVARTLSDGKSEERKFRPHHIIQATGHAGEINFPVIQGMEQFQGTRICHSSQFRRPQCQKNEGKRAVVVGACNSAHDIAQDFHDHGYHTTMVQRSSTCVDPTQYYNGKGLYAEDGPPTEIADFLTQSDPSALLKTKQIEVTEELNEKHGAFFDGLRKAGFALNNGPDGSGRKLKYLEGGGGYYIDVGASQLIIDGRIKVKQGQEISRITAHGLLMTDGTELLADEIVFATGYSTMQQAARKIFGAEVVDKCHEVWGLNDEGELNSVWRRSGHAGFWFAGGNLALSRYYSRMLALQIKAIEEGLMTYDDM